MKGTFHRSKEICMVFNNLLTMATLHSSRRRSLLGPVEFRAVNDAELLLDRVMNAITRQVATNVQG
jgi:hypothetical protein